MVRWFRAINKGIQTSLTKQWWHCSHLLWWKPVRGLISVSSKLRQEHVPGRQNVFIYVLKSTYKYKLHERIHTHRPLNMWHIWSWAIALCFSGLCSCRPAGLGLWLLCLGGQICWIWTGPLSFMCSTAHTDDSLMGEGHLEPGNVQPGHLNALYYRNWYWKTLTYIKISRA